MTPAFTPESLQWTVNGLRISGLGWGDPRGKPLLALHGWLDNAASFACLAPLLHGYHVVALDLTGHGLSDRRSADASYQIWDDLPEIQGVVDQLGWERFALMGHSRGAIIAGLVAAASADRVSHLLQLDASFPEPVPESEFSAQLRRFLIDKQRQLGRENRVFGTFEEAVRVRGERGLEEGAARLLVQRNLVSCEGGYTWSTDPRLYGASAVKLSERQVDAVLEGLCMPVLLVLAERGLDRQGQVRERVERLVPDVRVETVAGGHHFHMESGVGDLAGRVLRFLALEPGKENR